MVQSLDKQAILSRLGGNEALLVSVIKKFVEVLPQQWSSLQTALQQADGPTLAKLLHRLKGSSAYFGDPGLAQLLGQLEGLARAPQLELEPLTSLMQELRTQLDQLLLALEQLSPGH